MAAPEHPPSVHFSHFMASLAPGPSWPDDVDTYALGELQGEERERALELLVEQLAQRDPRVPRAFATIDAKEQTDALRAALPAALDRFKVELALAIWQLSGDTGVLASVTEVLRSGDNDGRIRALSALRQAPAEVRDVEAILAALDDPTPLVRQHAWMTLLAHIGVAFQRGAGAVQLAFVELASRNAPEHARGAHRARALWSGWRAQQQRGETLDLHDQETVDYQRLHEAAQRGELDVVAAGYGGLNATEQCWIERLLLAALEKAPSVALIEFLGEIGSILALEGLRELADDPALGAASTAAIVQLEVIDRDRT